MSKLLPEIYPNVASFYHVLSNLFYSCGVLKNVVYATLNDIPLDEKTSNHLIKHIPCVQFSNQAKHVNKVIRNSAGFVGFSLIQIEMVTGEVPE